MTTLEVLFTPADFAALTRRDLSQTACVVFDVLRATSTMVTALANGAASIMPVAEISEALDARRRSPDVLLAGERGGVRIGPHLTGSIAFDLGNSPREFTAERVQGKTIIITTTNGTRALRACAPAALVLAGSFLNLSATARCFEAAGFANLLIVCSGTLEEASYEDVLGAGALCEKLWHKFDPNAVADSAFMARRLFQTDHDNLAAALSRSRNGRRLLSRPELREDVAFCARIDALNLIAKLGKDGLLHPNIVKQITQTVGS